jgi:uncharacterized protein (TIGR03083 family)
MAAVDSLDSVLAVLRASHERLATALAPLTDAQLSAGSYCRDWSVAQVASHLGSGAEIFAKFVDVGLAHDSAGSVEFQPVWDKWNAKSPRAQVDDVVDADRAFLNRVEAIGGGARERWELEVFGRRHTLASLLRMRLAEHAVHTWDVAVTFEPTATVTVGAAEVIVDNLADLVARAGKPGAGLPPVHVVTSDPARHFTLELGAEPARLLPAADEPARQARLELPAEALVRLVYGRLDADHTPQNTKAHGIDLDALRQSFPGF